MKECRNGTFSQWNSHTPPTPVNRLANAQRQQEEQGTTFNLQGLGGIYEGIVEAMVSLDDLFG